MTSTVTATQEYYKTVVVFILINKYDADNIINILRYCGII